MRWRGTPVGCFIGEGLTTSGDHTLYIYIPSRARGRVSHDPFWGIIETHTDSREGPIMGHIMGPIMVLFRVPLMETYDVPL